MQNLRDPQKPKKPYIFGAHGEKSYTNFPGRGEKKPYRSFFRPWRKALHAYFTYLYFLEHLLWWRLCLVGQVWEQNYEFGQTNTKLANIFVHIAFVLSTFVAFPSCASVPALSRLPQIHQG